MDPDESVRAKLKATERLFHEGNEGDDVIVVAPENPYFTRRPPKEHRPRIVEIHDLIARADEYVTIGDDVKRLDDSEPPDASGSTTDDDTGTTSQPLGGNSSIEGMRGCGCLCWGCAFGAGSRRWASAPSRSASSGSSGEGCGST